MHPNPAFRQSPAQHNLALARQIGFGMLTINGPEGPLAAHVPFVLSTDGTVADLHLARSNPIARAILPAPALLAAQGPQHYISPDWYGPHEEVPDQVPTWNYLAVHLRGTLAALPSEALHTQLEQITAEHEERLLPKRPWTMAKMSEGAATRMMRMIQPFRLTIAAVDGTWKLGQNKAEPLRQRAAAALDQQPGVADAQRLAGLMRGDGE